MIKIALAILRPLKFIESIKAIINPNINLNKTEKNVYFRVIPNEDQKALLLNI